MKKRITKKRIRAARDFLRSNWPLRQSVGRWAGGAHSVFLDVDKKPSCEGWSTRVWSSNGKWSGTNSAVKLLVTKEALRTFPMLVHKDGTLILDCKEVGDREHKVIFVKQARGFDIRPAYGFMIRGYLSTKKTLEKARVEADAARRKALFHMLKLRQEKIEMRRVWVSVEDSITAGNCREVTNSVERLIKAKYGNIGAIRADALLSFRNDFYVRRAISAASSRKLL